MSGRTTYQSHGVPLETYELARADHRNQRTSEDLRRHVERLAAQWRAEKEADPELRKARRANVEHVVNTFLRTPGAVPRVRERSAQ